MPFYLWSRLLHIILVSFCFSIILFIVFHNLLWIKWYCVKHENVHGAFHTKDGMVNVDKWWKFDSPSKVNCVEWFHNSNLNVSESDYELDLKAPGDETFTTMSCSDLQDYWSFPNKPGSVDEEKFPLAYVFLGQKNLFQTLSLFRSIYWSQNIYCLNWDAKSSDSYQNLLSTLSSCFSNVIVPSVRRNIYWGDYSLLKATMDCVNVLMPFTWNYLQIVSWNDYPLKTNYEMVKIFKSLNGANDVSLGLANMDFIYKKSKASYDKISLPPSSLILYKGSFAVALSKNFVEFVVQNQNAQRFYKWLNGTWCAEEHFWSTLNHNLHLNPPGGYPGACLQFHLQSNTRKPFISRYQLWPHTNGIPCKGKTVHKSCLFGLRDLADLIRAKHLWAHKLYQDFQPATLYCLQKWFFRKVAGPRSSFDSNAASYYANLAHVKYHNLKHKVNYEC